MKHVPIYQLEINYQSTFVKSTFWVLERLVRTETREEKRREEGETRGVFLIFFLFTLVNFRSFCKHLERLEQALIELITALEKSSFISSPNSIGESFLRRTLLLQRLLGNLTSIFCLGIWWGSFQYQDDLSKNARDLQLSSYVNKTQSTKSVQQTYLATVLKAIFFLGSPEEL